jgi:hypothetical protein
MAAEKSTQDKAMAEDSAQPNPIDMNKPVHPPRVAGLEPGWELAPRAEYTATQSKGEVTIKATGQHPSSNYAVKLVPSMLRIWPPQYMLARHKTSDMGAQVLTPFSVMTSFKSDDPVTQVRVSAGAGEHDVKVQQVSE